MARALSQTCAASVAKPGAAGHFRSCSCSRCSRQRARAAIMEEEQFLGTVRSVFDQLTGCRIEDRTALTPKSKRIRQRNPSTVYALVLHQMAFSRGSDSTRYDSVTAHYAILPDGKILQLHPISAYLYASNGFNAQSVAVEFVGNLPSTRGRCWKPEKFGCHQLTEAQIQSGRCLVRHLIRTIGLTHILAHRQASGTRGNCPGPDIWYNVGQWAVENLDLKDGGPGFKIGTGTPIPDEWRNWGRSGTSREMSERHSDTTFPPHEEPTVTDALELEEDGGQVPFPGIIKRSLSDAAGRGGANRRLRRQLAQETLMEGGRLEGQVLDEMSATEIPTPGRYYQIKKGDNGLLTVAGHVRTEGTREQRAKIINNHPHNRKFWRTPRNAYERRVFPDGIISFSPLFRCDPLSNNKKCYARIFIPPVHIVIDDPTVITPDKPPPPAPEMLLEEWIPRAIRFYDSYPDADNYRRMSCILKLLSRSGVDDGFLTSNTVSEYERLSATAAAGVHPSMQTTSARKILKSDAKWSKNFDDFKYKAAQLDNMITGGIGRINYHYGFSGSAPALSSIGRLHRWVAGRMKDKKSIYSCYGK